MCEVSKENSPKVYSLHNSHKIIWICNNFIHFLLMCEVSKENSPKVYSLHNSHKIIWICNNFIHTKFQWSKFQKTYLCCIRCLHFIDKGSHPMRMERNRVQNPKLYEWGLLLVLAILSPKIVKFQLRDPDLAYQMWEFILEFTLTDVQ